MAGNPRVSDQNAPNVEQLKIAPIRPDRSPHPAAKPLRPIGTPRFGHKGLSQILLCRVARIFGTHGGPRKIAHDLRTVRVLPAGFSLICGR